MSSYYRLKGKNSNQVEIAYEELSNAFTVGWIKPGTPDDEEDDLHTIQFRVFSADESTTIALLEALEFAEKHLGEEIHREIRSALREDWRQGTKQMELVSYSTREKFAGFVMQTGQCLDARPAGKSH